MFKKYPDILTVSQVAEALGVGKKAVYKLIKNHLLGCIPVGRKYLVPKYCLVEYMGTARLNVKL